MAKLSWATQPGTPCATGRTPFGVSLSLLFAVLTQLSAASEPLRLHPENPRYFLFRGKPTVLITSGEHYGAVLNLDFDYVRYLDELQSKGLNLTRTFSGSYREVPGSFKIPDNTLAPAPGRFLCPWARSGIPGASDGGNKFDLTKWDEAYFRRLRDFVAQAGKRGIVVELVLFCVLYNDDLWNVSPMNARNNVNGVGEISRETVLSFRDPALNRAQAEMVRKIVRELNDFDNLYYELVNEPYFASVSQEYHDFIARTIADTEAGLPNRHLVAQNFNNGFDKVCPPSRFVSILNFHYANPPVTVAMNYDLHKVISFDEDGFEGITDGAYRANAWEFLLAGGGVYSGLDYSFTAKHPDGTFLVPQGTPGGGSPAFRTQLRILKEFIEGTDFIHAVPNNAMIKGGVARGDRLTYVWKHHQGSWWGLHEDPDDPRAWALVEEGKAYALYIRKGGQVDLVLDLPAGRFSAEWINTLTGKVDKSETFNHSGGDKRLGSPTYTEDVALHIKRLAP